MSKRVTLTALAKECDVSIGAVSRILSGDKTLKVRDSVRKRVVETAAKLNYRPNAAAQNLRRGKTGLIGIFGRFDALADPANKEYVYGIEERLRASDKHVFYDFPTSSDDEDKIFQFRVDAAILLQAPSDRVVSALQGGGIPYLSVNEKAKGSALSIIPNERQGVTLALQHLKDLGHTRIAYANAFSGMTDHFSCEERYDALIEAARKLNLEIVAGHDRHEAQLNLDATIQQSIIQEKATGMLTYNYYGGIAALRAARDAGLTIPHDFALVSFDNVYPMGEICPSVTTIGIDYQAMGRMAADRAIALAEDDRSLTKGTVLIDYALTQRESSSDVVAV